MKKFLFIFIALGLICFGFQAKQVHAAISFVQATSTVSGNSSFNLIFGSNVTAGDLIVACIDTYLSATSSVPTDSLGNTYALAAQEVGAGSPATSAYCYDAANVNGGADTVTFYSGSGYEEEASIAEYSGIATTTPLDATSSAANSATTTWTSGATAMTVQANEVAVGFFGFENATPATFSVGASYTSRATQGSGTQNYLLEDRILSFRGSQAALASVSTADGGPWQDPRI